MVDYTNYNIVVYSSLFYWQNTSLPTKKLPVSLGIYINGDYFKCPQDNEVYNGLNF